MSSRVTYEDLEAFLDEIENEPEPPPRSLASPPGPTHARVPSNSATYQQYNAPAEEPAPEAYEPQQELGVDEYYAEQQAPEPNAFGTNSLGLTAEEMGLLNSSSQYDATQYNASSEYPEIDLTSPRGLKLENDNLRIKVQLYEQQRESMAVKVKELELKNAQLDVDLKRAQLAAKAPVASGRSSVYGAAPVNSGTPSGIDDKIYQEVLNKLNKAEKEIVRLAKENSEFRASEAALKDQLTVAFSEHANAEKELTSSYEQLHERITQLADTVAYADALREELELERERTTELEVENTRFAPLKEGISDVQQHWLDAEEKVRTLTAELEKSKAETEAAQSKLSKIMNLPGLASFNASSSNPIDLANPNPQPVAAPAASSNSRNRQSHSRGNSSGGSGGIISPNGGGISLREGSLEKFSNKKLQKRYFVLKPTSIVYYKNEKADRAKPLGSMDIVMAQITILDEAIAMKDIGQKYAFKLLDPASLNSFVLVCDTEALLKDWTESLWKLNKAAQLSGASRPRPMSIRLAPINPGPASSSPVSPGSSSTPTSPNSQTQADGMKSPTSDSGGDAAPTKRKSTFMKRLSSKINTSLINSGGDKEKEKEKDKH